MSTDIATKADITAFRTGVQEQLTKLDGRVTNIENNMATKGDIADVKTDLTWRLIGLLIPFAGLISGGFFAALEIYRP